MYRRVGKWLHFQSRRGLATVPGFSNFLSDLARNDRTANNVVTKLNLDGIDSLKSTALIRLELQDDLEKEGWFQIYILNYIFCLYIVNLYIDTLKKAWDWTVWRGR